MPRIVPAVSAAARRLRRPAAVALALALACALGACSPNYVSKRAGSEVDEGVVGAPAWRLDNPPAAPEKAPSVGEKDLPPAGTSPR